MKIFLPILIISFALVMVPGKVQEKNFSANEFKKYRNSIFKYEIEHRPGYALLDQAPELVILEKNTARIRINAGCFDFGTETLTSSVETISFKGLPAMKENYYFQSQLKTQRISFEKNGQCFALELMAESEGDWAEANEIASTFQFTN